MKKREKNKVKKYLGILMIMVMAMTFALAGCGREDKSPSDGSGNASVTYSEQTDSSQGGAGGSSSADGQQSVSGGEGSQSSQGGEGGGQTEPNEVSAKILVVSDVHISEDVNTQNHLKKTLLYALDNGVDAIIFNGDTANTGEAKTYGYLDGVFEDAYGAVPETDRPELIFNMGNHEFYPSDNCAHEETVYSREFGLFKAFAEKWGAAIEDNVFVRDVNGIKCVIAFPSDENNFVTANDIILKATGQKLRSAGETVYLAAAGGYSLNDVDKVKAKFDEILAGGYDKNIVFCTHHPLGETYGSTIYGMESGSETMFKNLLKDYPQTVHLAGHTHFSSLHERSIAQNDWTSIQIGMHTYGKYVSAVDQAEDGKLLNYANITGKRYNSSDAAAVAYHGSTHFGMLLSFDSEKMTAERVDLSLGEIYPHGSWTVPYGITKANKHDKFYYEAGERQGETLHFAEDAKVKLEVVNGEAVGVTFEDVEEYWACEGYEILIGDGDGNALKRILWSSHFWMGLKEKQTYNIALSDIPVKDDYTLRIRAINFFGKYSEPCGDSVEVETSTENHPHKTLIHANTSWTDGDRDLKAYKTISFYYKIESGGQIAVAIVGDNWGTNYYGYFEFNASGAVGTYAGVSCVEQTDGYYLVTMTIASLTKTNGSAPDKVQSFYIRGAYSTAEVYIDDVRFEE